MAYLIYLLLMIPIQIGFVLITLFVVSAYLRRWIVEPHISFAVALTGIGVLGALYFWIALWWIDAANWLRIIALLSVIFIAYGAYTRRLYHHELLFPLTALAVGSVLLCVLLVARADAQNMLQSAANIWRGMPVDNEIPYLFAMNLWNGRIDIPLLPEWHASDRPPLQSGLFLLLQTGIRPNPIRYEICGIVLQMTVAGPHRVVRLEC